LLIPGDNVGDVKFKMHRSCGRFLFETAWLVSLFIDTEQVLRSCIELHFNSGVHIQFSCTRLRELHLRFVIGYRYCSVLSV